MAYDAEKLAALSDAELKVLEANVKRLGGTGSAQQKAEAERLTPLIASEHETRRLAKPAPAPRAKKTAAKVKA